MNKIVFDFRYKIIIFNDDVNDEDFGLTLARENYCHLQKNKIESLTLTEEEINLLVDVFDIINEVNDSIIGIHEDDIIYSNEIKRQCISKLEKFIKNQSLKENKLDLTSKILELFKEAYSRNKNIYFLF